MSGCLIYSDMGSVSERLAELLQRDRPDWLVYRVSGWEAGLQVASEHSLSWIVLAAPLDWQTVSAVAELRRLAPEPPIVLFTDTVAVELRSVLAEHQVALLPQLALETLFSQQGDDMVALLSGQAGAELTNNITSRY